MSDLETVPLAMEAAEHSMTAQLLNQILAQAHPLLAEGLMLAAIPHAYDVPLFRALRAQPDERDEKMALRLAQFSFIRVAEPVDGTAPRYVMQSIERDILHRRWIAQDPAAYTAAHARALAFWQAHPDPDPFTQAQTLLYHQLLVEPEAGTVFLLRTFRDYLDNRQLAALDRLLATATESYPYLTALGVSTDALDDTLAFLTARMAQARGHWQQSLDTLATLRNKPTLWPVLRPYVRRAYGVALTELGHYVEAIEELEGVLTLHGSAPGSELEQAYTMIALGDAYRDMAVAARGYRTRFVDEERTWQTRFQRVLRFPPVPLVAYLNWHGLRLWHPEVWAALHKQDWIIVRLLGSAARWYRQAERRLEGKDERTQRPQAIIKLAQLYLTLGDARQTLRLCESLLADERFACHAYREAIARTGLGLALLRRNDPPAAFRELEAALPALVAYEDAERTAIVHEALAEGYLLTQRYAESISHLTEALQLYLKDGDAVAATDVAERLEQVATDPALDETVRQQASQASHLLTHRVYPLQFHHPFLVIFHRASLVLLALLCFLLPMLAIRIDAQEVMQLHIVFEAVPPLQSSIGQAPLATELLVVESGYASGAVPRLVPVYALGAALWLLGAYVLTYLALGALLIARTRLSTVQATTRDQAIRLDPESITMGERGRGRSLPWSAVRHLIQLDVELMGQPLRQSSETLLATEQERLVVQGTTSWYPALRDRIAALVPPQAQRTRDVRRTLRGWMGALYVLGLLSLFLFTLLYLLAPDVLNRPFGSMPYDVTGIYPYLYVALFIPPLWWGVVRPLLYLARTQRHRQMLGLLILAGAGLALLRLLLPGKWLVPPDIYPSLSVMALLGSAIAAIWVAQRQTLPGGPPDGRMTPTRLAALTLVLGALVLVAALHVAREVTAYHFVLLGNQALTDVARLAEAGPTGEAGQVRLADAEAYYSRVLAIDPDHVLALRGRGAAMLQRGDFEGALADFDHALTVTDEPAEVYADRAIAYVSRHLHLSERDPVASEVAYQAALSDFEEAIRLDPDNALFYVWRGTTYQVAGDTDLALADYAEALSLESDLVPALINLGWLHFQLADGLTRSASDPTLTEAQREALFALAEEEYQQALASFEEAAAIEAPDSNLLLALGYVQYRLEQWQTALDTWSEAVERDPTNAVALVSRGTARWRLAIEGDVCSNRASAEENAIPAASFEAAIRDLEEAIRYQPENDYTYRTLAQLHFALRNCQPHHQFEDAVRAAIYRYEEAVALAPDNAGYWLFLARVQTSLALSLASQPDRAADVLALLDPALLNVGQARRLAPDDGEILRWQRFIAARAALGAMTLGDRDRAVTLYNDWSALLPPAEQVQTATTDLAALVAAGTLEPDALLALHEALSAELPALVARTPELEKMGGFWFTRSYFAFHLGRALFMLGEARVPERLLQEADALAPRATALDSVNEFYPRWERFVSQGGWGWYHLRRGDARFNAEERAAALADFATAARLIPPDDVVTQGDATEAAFKAGHTALLLGDPLAARDWYEEGIRRATAAPAPAPARMQAALDDLLALPAATRSRVAGLEEMVGLLEAALE